MLHVTFQCIWSRSCLCSFMCYSVLLLFLDGPHVFSFNYCCHPSLSVLHLWKIYTSIICTTPVSYQSSTTYSNAALRLKADVAHLDVFDQWCLWRILKITLKDHITNTDVHERTGLPAVSETISQRRPSMNAQVYPLSARPYLSVDCP